MSASDSEANLVSSSPRARGEIAREITHSCRVSHAQLKTIHAARSILMARLGGGGGSVAAEVAVIAVGE